MKLKVCGLKYESNLTELINLQVDYFGFIFFKKSPRYVNEELSSEFLQTIPARIKKVGVFVNEDPDVMISKITKYNLEMVQLHGNESVEICRQLKERADVIKAFQINENFDFDNLHIYKDVVSYYLFDTASDHYGGSGKTFNWRILSKYKGDIPFFLSGGIHENHDNDINNMTHPQLAGIDINSQFETEPGLKDISKIKQFIKKLNIHGSNNL